MTKQMLSGVSTVLVVALLVLLLVMPVQASSGSYIPDDPVTPQPEQTPETVATPDVLTVPESTDGAAALAAPVISVWYEGSLKFGAYGTPQDQINILGNVSDDGSVSSLSYSLNGSSPIALDLGPNSTRLARKGDFNAAIPVSSLIQGTNTVLFTARDNSGGTTTRQVTFPFSSANTWPIPYTTNWAGAASIYDQAQVVDGLWQITGSGVRVTQQGYDRLIAIGNMNWSNYEVLVPVTIHQFYPVGDDEGGVGIIAKWQGHHGSGQPPTSWDLLGAYAYYSNRRNGLTLRLDDSKLDTVNFPFSFNRTYMFRLRAEAVGSSGRYSFKVWEKGQPEPSNWQFTNVVDTTETRLQGSVLLVAHRADATFGDVTICPLSGAAYSLSVAQSGQGTVTRTPDKPSYNCGESVTLSASVPSGWVFGGWTGDVQSTSSTVTINVTRNMNVTARFSQAGREMFHSYLPSMTND